MSADVVNHLTSQHEQIDLLLARIRACGADAPSAEERQALVPVLVERLSEHLALEQEVLYPTIRHRLSPAVHAELLLEHQEIKRALANLIWLDADDARFAATLASCESLFCGHAAYQHEELFELYAKLASVTARAA